MNRHGYKLSLTQLDATTWRAMFHRDFMLAEDGFGADQTPWGAVRTAVQGVSVQGEVLGVEVKRAARYDKYARPLDRKRDAHHSRRH